MTTTKYAINPAEQIANRAAKGTLQSGEVLTQYTTRETVDLIRRRDIFYAESENALAPIGVPTAPVLLPEVGGRIAPLLHVVPTIHEFIWSGEEVPANRIQAAAPTPFGTVLPQASVGFTKVQPLASRVGTSDSGPAFCPGRCRARSDGTRYPAQSGAYLRA